MILREKFILILKSEFKNLRLLHPLIPKVRNDNFYSCHREIWEKGIVAISDSMEWL